MIELRPIRESDFERAREIFSEAFHVTAPPPIEYIANLCYTEPEGCLVASSGGEVIGYACSHRSGRVGYLGNLAVQSSHRGKGYGKALTLATRDYLRERCDIVGLALEPNLARNLELYSDCGFAPVLPSCHVWKKLSTDSPATHATTVRTARQLGDKVQEAIQQIRGWSDDVFPGLDLTRDLQRFAQVYPDRLWIDFEDLRACGFLAYHELFRGDPWGAVRPGARDIESLMALVAALEASASGETLWFHFHTSFPRVLKAFRARGYRVGSHKSNMVLEGQTSAWPQTSDALLLRPWWT